MSRSSIPAAAGIGLRGAHHQTVLDQTPDVAWFEVHSENYLAPDSVAAKTLLEIRKRYPLSLHGVGLSLGSTDPLNLEHLDRLKALIDHVSPGLLSEHLSWSSVGGNYLHDLLPLPYTEEALVHVSSRIEEVQERLDRTLSIENVSSYLQFAHSTISEPEFLAEISRRTGCGILLDVNNVYVSAVNLGFVPSEYLAAIPMDRVTEIHLAGHSEQVFDGQTVLVDTHDHPVCDAVWKLFGTVMRNSPPVPVLIEWDAQLPGLDVLMAEAEKAQLIMDRKHANVA
jgi:hypothetical protein